MPKTIEITPKFRPDFKSAHISPEPVSPKIKGSGTNKKVQGQQNGDAELVHTNCVPCVPTLSCP